MAQPLHFPGTTQPEEPLESPEVLMINALLEAPEGFKPELYGVSAEMLSAHSKAWHFCEEYQTKTDGPPGKELFHRSFPEFELLANVDPKWAAAKLIAAHEQRRMRLRIKEALSLTHEGDVEAAKAMLAELARPVDSAVVRGVSIYDPVLVGEAGGKVGFPFPWQKLEGATRGLGLGELMYVAARLGEGKSWLTPYIAASLAEAGASVGVMTLEMPREQWGVRIQSILAGEDTELRRGLYSEDHRERLKAQARLPKIPGRVDILDPSMAPMNTRTVAMLATEYQYVVVDHVGLLQNKAGKKPIEDWRVQGEVSNTLKEITLTHKVGILAAAQVNREGESSSYIPPKLHQLAGSDDLGRDADMVITLRRMQERSMAYYLAKNRHGANVRWYTRFEPKRADFSEISKDQALERARQDEERVADK